MDLSQSSEAADAITYLTGIPVDAEEQQHDDGVQYVEIICEEGSEVSFMGEGSGVGYMGETIVLEEAVVSDANMPISESQVVTPVANICEEPICVPPLRNGSNVNSRSLLRINNINRQRSDLLTSDTPSSVIIDENSKVTGGEEGQVIMEMAVDDSMMVDSSQSLPANHNLDESSKENLHIKPDNSAPVFHTMVSEAEDLTESYIVPQQDLSVLCSIGFQSDAGDVLGTGHSQVIKQCPSSFSTPGPNTPISRLQTPESVKSLESPFASLLKALPDFSFTTEGGSEPKLDDPSKVAMSVVSTPSLLPQMQSGDGSSPLSLYTLIPNVDGATADTVCVNMTPADADTLQHTLNENSSSDILPVMKLITSTEESSVNPQTSKPKSGKPGPIFKICRVVRRPNGTVTCMQTDMRNISLGDRQAVYRTMLEKFPDIVHSKVNSVLNAQRTKKRPRQSLSKTAAPPVNPQMVVSSEEVVSTQVEEDVVQEMCVDDSTIVLDEVKPALEAQLSTTSEVESTTDLGNNDLEGLTESTPVVIDEGSMEANDQTATLSAEAILTNIAEGGSSATSITTCLTSSTAPLSLSTPSTDEDKLQEISAEPLAEETDGGLVKLKSILSKLNSIPQAKQILGKSVRIKPPASVPAHVCKSETTVTCRGCKIDFKSIVDFQNHALLSYVKAKPHIYDPNAVLTCALCQSESPSFSLMSTIQEHFTSYHSVIFTTACEECRKFNEREGSDQSKVDSETEDMSILGNNWDPDQALTNPKTRADVIRIVNRMEKHIFSCRYCEKEFDQRQMWRMHVRAHLGQQLMTCPLCGMSFHRKNSLSLHMRVHLSVRPKKEKSDNANDEENSKKRQRLGKNKQTDCESPDGANTLSEDGSVSPKIREDSGPILCELCGKALKNPRQLNQHQRRRHHFPCKRPIRVDLTPTPCERCGKVCSGPTALKNHQRHFCGLKEVLCEICGKVFPFGRRALSNHKYQVHKWRGSEMEKRAKEREKARLDLQSQIKKEIVDPDETNIKSPMARKFRTQRPRKEFKPQVCDLCGFVAKYSTSLRCHLVNKHKYPKKRIRVNFNCTPTACDKCGLVCKGPAGVKLHQNRFCGREQGNLACPICGKICSSRKNLSRHKYGHKWFGTEKEKAWKEKRKLLGLPLRGAGGRKPTLMTYASHVAAEVTVDSTDAEIGGNTMTVETMTEQQQEDLKFVANAIIKPEEVQEMNTHVAFMGEDGAVMDPTSQLLQAIANDPQFAGQTIQVTTEMAADIPDPNAGTDSPTKVTTYRVVRLVNHLGEPMLAYLPDVQDGT